jgi:hypothetical protein
MSNGNSRDNRPKGPGQPGGGGQQPIFKRPQATIDLKATEIVADAAQPAPQSTTKPADTAVKAASDTSKDAVDAARALATAAATAAAADEAQKSKVQASVTPAPEVKAAATAVPTSATPTIKSTTSQEPPKVATAGPAPKAITAPMAPQQKSSGGFGTHLAAGLLGGALTLGAAHGLGPQFGLFGNGAQTAQNAELAKRLQSLEASVRTPAANPQLDQRLKQIEDQARALTAQQTAVETTARAADQKATQLAADRVQKLEEQIASFAAIANTDPQRAGRLPQLAQLQARVAELDRIEREFGQIKGDAQTTGSRAVALEASVKRLLEENGQLRAQLDTLRSDLGGRAKPQDVAAAIEPVTQKMTALERNVQSVVKSEQERNVNAERVVLSLELGNLKRALDRGQKYTSELAAIRKLAGDKLDLAALEKFAATGVPSVDALSTEFRALAFKAIDADSQPQDAGVMDRMMAGAKSMVRVRKTNPSEDDKSTEATLARMEQALKDGRSEAVLEASKPLSAKAQAAIKPWLDKITARAAADRAVQKLEADLKTALTGGGQPTPSAQPQPKG